MIPSQLALMGILAAVIFNIALGIIWYSPNFLGKIWLRSYRFQSAVLNKPSINQYIGTVIVSVIMAYVISILLSSHNVRDIYNAMVIGFFFWLGFIATTEFSSVLWERKPIAGYLIDVGYWLISLLVITPILARWH